MKFLVTGGAGFIGSAVIRNLIQNTTHQVMNVDKLTYAGNLDSLTPIDRSDRYEFAQIDICEREAIATVFKKFRPDVVMHLAAESHVDRSVDEPNAFMQTNLFGTFALLEAARDFWHSLPRDRQDVFRFHHVSTDEVFGDLGDTSELFSEDTPYSPSSPYSATKAGSDHLVRAWHRSYGLPVLVTNCSNNYGPYHFPEKLIPHMILNAIQGRELPVYGDGGQIRDWLYVEDHARALICVAETGLVGETYNIGGHNQITNLEVVRKVCEILDELVPDKLLGVDRYESLIRFVADRPGHDYRYAIDASKIERELGWIPFESFESGLRKTVQWYLDNEEWWSPILNGDYRLERLGIREVTL